MNSETINKNDSLNESNEDCVVVYSAFKTLRNGKRIYAKHYGLEAFRFEIPRSKYRH